MVCMRIHTRRGDFRYAVMRLFHDFFGDFFGVVGDDVEFVGDLKALQNKIAYFARGKQRDEREQNGIELDGEALPLIIYEKGSEHDDCVEDGRERADADKFVFFIDERGEHRRSARRSAAFQHDRKGGAQENAACDSR